MKRIVCTAIEVVINCTYACATKARPQYETFIQMIQTLRPKWPGCQPRPVQEQTPTYGSVGGEPVLGCGTSVGERELESWLEELLDVRPPDVFLLFNLGDSENLDIPESSSVSGSHVLVHGLDGLGSGKSSELLDHLGNQSCSHIHTDPTYVVGTGSGVVSEPDGKVLDLQWLLLVDLWIGVWGRG